eukprot:Stramenopile-MAST_4_protein_5694
MKVDQGEALRNGNACDAHVHCRRIQPLFHVHTDRVRAFVQDSKRGVVVKQARHAQPSLLYGYLFGAGILARMTMPDFKSMMATKNATMGKYKYTQSTVRTHSESIAFFGGGAREKAIAWKRFEATMKVDEEKAFADLWFGWIKNLFVRNMPDRVQQHLRFQFAVNNFQDDDSIIRDGGAALTMGQHVIWGIQTAVKRSVQELVDVSDKFNNLSGVIFRLAELQSTLH